MTFGSEGSGISSGSCAGETASISPSVWVIFDIWIDAYADRRETPTAFAAGSPRTGVPCRTTRRRRE